MSAPLYRSFAQLAQRAAQRQAVILALRLAAETGPWFLVVCVAAGLLALMHVHVGWWLGLTVPLWAISIVVLAWMRRPAAARALAQWDAAAARADGFLNAWDFERSGAAEPFARAHLAAMRQAAPTAALRLAKDLPLPWSRDVVGRVVLAPLACMILALSGVWSPVAVPLAAQLGSDERERFAATTTELATEAQRLTELAGLAPSEKTSAEELAKRLAEAKAEAETKGLTAHEALAAMDRLAKDAEKLAEQLADAPAASAALLDELAKHADTAALAEALRSGDLAKAAAAAEALAAKAARTDTSLEEQRRLEEALKAATAAAEAAGDKGAVAKALAEAKEGLAKQSQQAGQAKRDAKPGAQQAGKALSSLAKSLAASATRKQAAKQVQQLAQRLRSGGGKVLAAGAKPGNNPKANSPVSNKPFTPNAKPSMPTPGAKPKSSSGGGKPGSGSCAGGSCPGGSGTPVPGTQPGEGSGAGAGSGTAQTPVPGVGLGLAKNAGRGGAKAGRGHVDRSMAPSAVRSTVDGGTVDAAQGNGDSTTRTVAGSEHGEDSALPVSATPAALIDAEEKALDAEPLPLARREQVKRYFALLRASADAADAK